MSCLLGSGPLKISRNLWLWHSHPISDWESVLRFLEKSQMMKPSLEYRAKWLHLSGWALTARDATFWKECPRDTVGYRKSRILTKFMWRRPITWSMLVSEWKNQSMNQFCIVDGDHEFCRKVPVWTQMPFIPSKVPSGLRWQRTEWSLLQNCFQRKVCDLSGLCFSGCTTFVCSVVVL